MLRIGEASETMMCAGFDTSAWLSSVEPHRDIWKMKPDGFNPAGKLAAAAITVRCWNSWLKGRVNAQTIVS